jgi:GNAT superfamily N-acetyltransferase
MKGPPLRPATPDDAPRLRAVAEASKGYWGYDPVRVRDWAATLDFSREIWVAEVEGELVAWSALRANGDGTWVLDDLWVSPEAIGTGIGRTLFQHAADRARTGGAHTMRWEADPNAVAFYEHMGADTIGTVTSEWGRTLPVMQVEL